MYQQESIYNLVPKGKIIPGKGASYHSRYPANTFPTASTFIPNNSSFPGTVNCNGDISKISLYNIAGKKDMFTQRDEEKVAKLDTDSILTVQIYNGVDTLDTDSGNVIYSHQSKNHRTFTIWKQKNSQECYIYIRGIDLRFN